MVKGSRDAALRDQLLGPAGAEGETGAKRNRKPPGWAAAEERYEEPQLGGGAELERGSGGSDQFFGTAAKGLGGLALATLLAEAAFALPRQSADGIGGLPSLPHFAPTAKRCIYLHRIRPKRVLKVPEKV